MRKKANAGELLFIIMKKMCLWVTYEFIQLLFIPLFNPLGCAQSCKLVLREFPNSYMSSCWNLKIILQVSEVFQTCHFESKGLMLIMPGKCLISCVQGFQKWFYFMVPFLLFFFFSSIISVSRSENNNKQQQQKSNFSLKISLPLMVELWNHAENLIKGFSIMVGFLPEICMWKVNTSLKELLFFFYPEKWKLLTRKLCKLSMLIAGQSFLFSVQV